MLQKIFSFLGFNTGDSLVGLSHLTEEAIKPEKKIIKPKNQNNIKLSDLLRGA